MGENKTLLISYSSLNTPGGTAVFVKRLSQEVKNCEVVSIQNNLNRKIEKNEFNLKAKTLFNEVVYIHPSILIKFIEKIYHSNIIHINYHNFFNLFILFFAVIFRKKIVFTMHTSLIFKGKNIKQRVEKIRSKIVSMIFLIFSHRFILITKAQKNGITSNLLKRNNKKIKIIYHFIKSGSILKRPPKHHSLKILFIGRLNQEKGYYDLIKLIKNYKINKIKFNFVGKEYPNTEKLTFENIQYYGIVPNEKIFKILDKNNVFILPSYTEVFPMTILEAMARGLVILVSDIPGIREIIKEGRNGYLFPAGDIKKLKEKILYLKNNPKDIERISKNNLRDIWRFTSKKQITKYIKIYEELLKLK
jgi:glycosyltransferase involved in cell wall biosynthesis